MQTNTEYQRAHASAQSHFDGLVPPALPDPFLETDEGINWLDDAVRALVQGDALVIKSRSVSASVTPQELHEAIAYRLGGTVSPDAWALEKILAVIAARGPKDPELYHLLQNLFGLSTSKPNACHRWSVVHDLAEGLISPYAEDHCRAERENSEDDDHAY
ncbi:MAG TPA: hypothetical protein VIZ86_16525 [Pseudomonas sp.]